MTGPSNQPRPPDGAASAAPSAPSGLVDDTHSRPPSRRDGNGERDGEREDIELTEIETHEDDSEALSSASVSSGEEYRITRTRSRISQQSVRSEDVKGIWGRVRRFWMRHVVLNVPEKSNRDHFGTLPHTSPRIPCLVSGIQTANASRSTEPRIQPSPIAGPMLMLHSAGANIPCIHPHLCRARNAGRFSRPALPSPTRPRP